MLELGSVAEESAGLDSNTNLLRRQRRSARASFVTHGMASAYLGFSVEVIELAELKAMMPQQAANWPAFP